jgi:hypothetical protein
MEDIAFPEKLKILRSFFEINNVFYSKNEEGIITTYIKPSDDKIELDTFFTIKLNEYDSEIKKHIATDNDLGVTHSILLNEKSILAKIASLKDSYEVINYFTPLYINDNLSLTTPLEYYTPDNTGYEYLYRHFIFRKDYIIKLLECIESNIFIIQNIKKSPIKINLVNKKEIEKILSELFYLLDVEYFQKESLSQLELSSIRYKLFEALGLSDYNYPKNKGSINERKPDLRFKDMIKLIEEVTKKIEKIPFRVK